jgi:hypothetical protein
MRHGTSGRRHRHRGQGQGGQAHGNGRRGGHQRAQVFDSNGPDVRIRGTAHQVAEKYATLAKDAASAGDRILEQSYLQYAEHYQRIINSWGEDVREGRPAYNPAGNGAFSPEKREDDLSLPSSILGDVPHLESKESDPVRAVEMGTV